MGKRKLTMCCTPTMKKKLQSLAKRSGCSMDFFIEACFRMAIQCFDGKTSDLVKMLAQQDAKPTKERHSILVTARLAPEVYEGLQRMQSRTGAASASADAPRETLSLTGSVPTDNTESHGKG